MDSDTQFTFLFFYQKNEIYIKTKWYKRYQPFRDYTCLQILFKLVLAQSVKPIRESASASSLTTHQL